MTESITQTLSCEEIHAGFDVLIERIGDLATGRNHALAVAADALEAACGLQQERDREKARADEQAAMALEQATLAAQHRDRLVEVDAELQQTRVTVRALEQQIDHMQNPPETRRDDHTRKWPFKRAGNAL